MNHTAYLDTCIVSGIAKKDVDIRELDALNNLLNLYKKDEILLFTSKSTLDELEKIPKMYRSKHIDIYNKLRKIPVAIKSKTTNILFMPGPILFLNTDDPLYSYLKKLLPDEKDAEHLFNTAKDRIVYFVTVDKKTILKFSELIESKTKIIALLPSQLIHDISDKK